MSSIVVAMGSHGNGGVEKIGEKKSARTKLYISDFSNLRDFNKDRYEEHR